MVLSGPEQEIEIVRDRYAVPHILSTTDHDAFFGLGYVHAQDRLWQMMLFRRTAQGRLSEIFGPDTVGIDTLMRQLDLYGLSREAVRVQTDATTAALEAYADGVNARLRVVQSEALGRGAPEFFLFTQEIAPWVPAELDRGAEAPRPPDDRQGGDGDAARLPLPPPAARAAPRPPARLAQRPADGPPRVLASSSPTARRR